MQLSRGKILFLLIAAGIFLGWKNLAPSASETAVLHIPALSNQDTYVTLWMVEDDQYVWIRAASSHRLWLDFLRKGGEVELARKGRSQSYQPDLINTDHARAYVDPLFREKYGLADHLLVLLSRGDTVPIRLQRL